MARLNDGLRYTKHQTSGYPLWNCVILLVTFVFTPVLSLPDSLKPGDDLKLISEAV